MANRLARLGAVLAAAASIQGCTAATPVITEKTIYYGVSGATEADIRKMMDQRRPRDNNNAERDSLTKWNVAWEFSLRTTRGCEVAKVTVEANISIHLPRLDPAAPPDRQQKFAAYQAKLLAHEKRHVQIAKETVQQVEDVLYELPPGNTCEALHRSADAAVQPLLQEAAFRNAAYDDETGYGETEGAVFP